jgi:hypothetical protein
MRIGPWFVVVSALLFGSPSTSAAPAGRAAVLQQVENSMLVTGTLHIETDGRVSKVILDKPELLPAGVAKLVRESAAGWLFEPVLIDAAPRPVAAPMSVRVVARQRDAGDFEVGIRSASFDQYDEKDRSNLRKLEMAPPHYPEPLYRAGASGTVYLLLKVGRDGKVEDVVAEQVNLNFAEREAAMQRFRDMFARNAITAARRWTYEIPSEGDQVDRPYWVLRVPVSYQLADGRSLPDSYGKWQRYVPGPRQLPSWRELEDAPGFSPDAIGEGVYLANRANSPKLLSPLGGI